jgi:hypothetical protein
MSVTTAAGAKVYQPPGEAGSPVDVKPRYENFIGGHWVAPVHGGQYAVWKHTQLIIDVGEGQPEGFSLPAGDDRQFVTRSRVFSPAELAALRD